MGAFKMRLRLVVLLGGYDWVSDAKNSLWW
jgi:hypothetical protein